MPVPFSFRSGREAGILRSRQGAGRRGLAAGSCLAGAPARGVQIHALLAVRREERSVPARPRQRLALGRAVRLGEASAAEALAPEDVVGDTALGVGNPFAKWGTHGRCSYRNLGCVSCARAPAGFAGCTGTMYSNIKFRPTAGFAATFRAKPREARVSFRGGEFRRPATRRSHVPRPEPRPARPLLPRAR